MGVSAIPPDRPLVVWHPGSAPPEGYIKANGALLSRAAYAWLFGKIGETFGAGDGSTTFALPDLRGEFLRGLDDGRGVDAARVLGSAQADMLKSHNHLAGKGGNGSTAEGALFFRSDVGDSRATSSTGGVETRPRNVAGLYCIAYAP